MAAVANSGRPPAPIASSATDAAIDGLAALGPPPPADLMAPPLSGADKSALEAAVGSSPASVELFVARQGTQRFLGPAGDLCRTLFGTAVTCSNALKRCSGVAASAHASRLKWDSRAGQPAADSAAFSSTVSLLLSPRSVEDLISANAAHLQEPVLAAMFAACSGDPMLAAVNPTARAAIVARSPRLPVIVEALFRSKDRAAAAVPVLLAAATALRTLRPGDTSANLDGALSHLARQLGKRVRSDGRALAAEQKQAQRQGQPVKSGCVLDD